MKGRVMKKIRSEWMSEHLMDERSQGWSQAGGREEEEEDI